MPAPIRSSTPDIYVSAHYTATDFLNHAQFALQARELEANILLPHAMKLREKERSGETIAPGQFWLICWSSKGQVDGNDLTLDFVLSCTESYMSTYPIFLFSNYPSSELTSAFLEPRVDKLAQKLNEVVDPERVFSMFGPTPLTKALAKAWSHLTGFRIESEPYYACTSSWCTRQTFRGARQSSAPDHILRMAVMSDLEEVANLCRDFAATGPPFILDDAGARKEATEMIKNRQLWVYEMPLVPGGPRGIATIVAVTRTSDNVAAITKVFTSDRFRKRGCADRLVAFVCKRLFSSGFSTITLYVGHTLNAVRVYDRVGFTGLDGKAKPEGVEDWLELGFAGTQLGHW